MSISRFQEKFLSPGCLTALGIAMALVFVGSSFYACSAGSNAQSTSTAEAQGQTVIAEVDGEAITSQQIQDAVNQQMKQFAAMGPLPAEQEAFLVAGALNQAIQSAAVQSLAKKAGVTFSEEQARAKFKEQIDQAVKQVREQLIAQKAIKENATEADVDKAFKAQSGKSLSEAIKQAETQFETALKDNPEQVKAPFLQQAYLEQEAKAHPASEADLRASFDTYTVKQVLLKGDDAQAQADKVAGELKGGLKFEDAMNRYSKDLPMPNKKVADNTITVTGAMLDQEPYKAIKGLKAGEVSAPSKSFEGVAIYKVISIKPDLPKDFDKNKAKLLEDFTKQKIGQDLQAKAAAIAKGEGVVWKSDIYKTLFSLNGQPGEDPKARETNLKTAAETAKTAGAKATGDEARLAALIRYSALNQLVNMPGADKAALQKDEIEAINDILKVREDASLRMTLVNLLAETKSPEAGKALLEAARYNNDTTEKGQGQYAAMAAKLRELKTANLINAEDATQVQTELSRWLKDKAAFEKAQADARATAPKPGTPAPGAPAPGGTTPPPATGKP